MEKNKDQIDSREKREIETKLRTDKKNGKAS